MFAQLVEDFVHLEGGENGFNQNGGADGAARYAEFVLRKAKNIVPQTRFQMALYFWQVEIRPGSFTDELLRVVEEVEPEIEQRGGDRLAVHSEMSLV